MALIEFKDLPDKSTPLNSTNLNNNFNYLNEKFKKKENYNCNNFSDFYSLWKGLIANRDKVSRGEIGYLHNTNLKTLLGSPEIGNYTNCIFEVLSETDSEGVVRITAYTPYVGKIKIAYLTVADDSDFQYSGWITIY